MLVLTRRRGEGVAIGPDIRIVVLGIKNGQVRLGLKHHERSKCIATRSVSGFKRKTKLRHVHRGPARCFSTTATNENCLNRKERSI